MFSNCLTTLGHIRIILYYINNEEYVVAIVDYDMINCSSSVFLGSLITSLYNCVGCVMSLII